MTTHRRHHLTSARPMAAALGHAAAALHALRPLLLAAAVLLAAAIPLRSDAQIVQRGERRTVKGGIMQAGRTNVRTAADSTAAITVDSLLRLLPEGALPQDADIGAWRTLTVDSLLKILPDTLRALLPDTAAMLPLQQAAADSLATYLPDSLRTGLIVSDALPDLGDDADGDDRQKEKRREKVRRRDLRETDTLRQEKVRQPLFSDSASLSRVCWMAAVMPGYGQIYNKQYWKLPVLYTTLGASIGVAIQQGSLYRPLKRQYDAITAESMSRTEELNALQRRMIRANTARQVMWATAAASYIYFLGDAAVNYATNDVSDVKKATTLSLICPGAGQVYNKSYWKVPIVIGGLASMAYVIDWNNRGFQRFKTAYDLRADFEKNPGKYPDGVSHDEFGGRYSATYLKNLRDAYRRNRDLSIILTIAVYAFQAIDAHVDAHLKDFDVSDDLTVSLEPMFDTTYTQVSGTQPTFGFNLNVRF